MQLAQPQTSWDFPGLANLPQNLSNSHETSCSGVGSDFGIVSLLMLHRTKRRFTCVSAKKKRGNMSNKDF